ncbi:MAG: hypothetical protein H6708_25925 [Kofleriaceae bacterium]|nr:hypothetical protein [Kofleriaceae bacterium]
MGLHDVLQGVEHGDVTEGLRGGLEMVSGVATTAEALGAAGMMGEVAAVTGAAATGLGIGSGMAHLADDDDLGRSPLYGHNDATGKDNTALDVSTHAASWVDDAVGGGVLGSIAGGTTAALGAMTMAPLGAETAAINWAANLLK